MTSKPIPDLDQRLPVIAVAEDGVEALIKSRERVKAHGEVFTPASMVNKMLDLVRPELESGPHFVDKTFFEPAAGHGNFLVAILRRKLSAIQKRYQPSVWPSESLFALASIYGVEFQEDNHEEAKGKMLDLFVAFHREHGVACTRRTHLYRSAAYLLDANILCGDSLMSLDHQGHKLEFSWWHRMSNVPANVQREVFTLKSLRDDAEGAFNLDTHPSYAPCRIDRVHLGESLDG